MAEAKRKTAQQKVSLLELMLGQIANYCPVISRNTIVKNSTSLSDIWQSIRLHYGFQSSGAHFLDYSDIKLEPDERPEDLFQRPAPVCLHSCHLSADIKRLFDTWLDPLMCHLILLSVTPRTVTANRVKYVHLYQNWKSL